MLKTFFKIIGGFLCVVIVVLGVISTSSHARIALIQHRAKSSIEAMVARQEEMKKQSLTPGGKP